MKEYILKSGQPGFGAGEAFLIRNKTKDTQENSESSEKELARLEAAAAELGQMLLAATGNGSKENAEIFESQKLLLEDREFLGAARELINTENVSAAEAVRQSGEKLAARFEESSSEYIRQRSVDVRGLSGRLLDLMSGAGASDLTKASIIVAEELSPAELSSLDAAFLRGIITVKGAPTTHVSIMAGNLGIPYLYGSKEAVDAIREGSRLILDGGKLILDPEEETYRKAFERSEKLKEKRRTEEAAAAEAKTRTKILANIAGPQDIGELLSSNAEGVGLFRSEFLFLKRETEPSEEEQFQAYRSVAEAMGQKETVIRTMDIGSDKSADWLKLPDEKNPQLGMRGLRVSLNDEHLLRTQLRALLRAAAFGNVRVMLPMIISSWEVETVRDRMKSYAKELEEEGIPYRIPPLGIMIETPAAVMIADELAEVSDFFSIGTNDLTQYTLALDREGQNLERFYDPFHKAVFRLIAATAEAGRKKKIPVAVCGELAGNENAVPMLIEAGVTELSVSISKIAKTRAAALKAEESLAKAVSDGAEGVLSEAASGKTEKNLSEAALGETEAPTPKASLKNQDSRLQKKAISSPAEGRVVMMKDIPDRAFSEGSMGKCIGILPDDGTISAPVDGTVTSVAKTKHAITFQTEDGRELLLHAGINTVRLGGDGFTVFVEAGDIVSVGQKVMTMDLDRIRTAGLSPIVIVVELETV